MFSKLDKWFVHSWLARLLLGEAMVLDEGLDVIVFGGEKSPHESTSAACGHNLQSIQPCEFCKFICWFIQSVLGRIWPTLKTHCLDAWKAEKQMVKDAPNLP